MAGEVTSAGLDPGVEGCLAVAHGGRVTALARWWPRGEAGSSRVWDLSIVTDLGDHDVERGLAGPGAIGQRIAWRLKPIALVSGGLLLGAELPYVGENARRAIDLAIFGGALIGQLEHLATRGRPRWVQPDQWRGACFRRKWWSLQAAAAGQAASRRTAEKRGIGFMKKREAAKREASMCVAPLLVGLRELADAAGGGHEHAFDAGGVLLWRSAQGR